MNLKSIAKRLPYPLRQALEARIERRRRKQIAMRYYETKLALVDAWAVSQSEITNFYYDITPMNRAHLAEIISLVTNIAVPEIEGYFSELEGDGDLRRHLAHHQRDILPDWDGQIGFARRIGWYTFVRILKPKVVVETGVDLGVGSCVLASALERNASEGAPGRYYGTDINPEAGAFFTGRYREFGEILYGDSIESLNTFVQPIDLFINDSDHSADYERREYVLVKEKLSPQGIILGDNAHTNDELLMFSRNVGRKFVFFDEIPRDHWYPGAGIGISFR